MRTFNEAERLKIYKQVLKNVRKDPSVDYGLCTAFARVVEPLKGRSFTSFEEDFPEIYEQQPVIWDNNFYWFPLTYEGWKKRIKLLIKAINNVQNKQARQQRKLS